MSGWPWMRRSAHNAAVVKLEDRLARTRKDLDLYRVWHWKRCDCHDSWDQCPCASDDHPSDASCDCCDLGTGLCGPKPHPAGVERTGREPQ